MPRRVIAKWRPPLALVLGGTLAAVFFLPILGITYFRLAGGVLGWAETAWMIGLMALVATLLLGFLLWRLVLRPVKTLTRFTRAEGALDVPQHFGTPEFSRLGQSLISMTETLQNREAVLRSYADHVTHEFKAPLTVIQGATELLNDDGLAQEDRAKLLAGVSDAAKRMQALLDSQRALAQAQEPMPEGECQLSDVAAGFRAVDVEQDGRVPLTQEVLMLVLGHLVDNALAHGATQIRVAFADNKLRVSDNGPGVSDGNRTRIFDPFFTTRRDAGGTGMGLPIVARMLQGQGAQIRLIEGSGAVFEISF
ncbi:sensor histidine kinase [Loktanella sp. S4079]|uniref:sensor histidine kinase n=1 Tax=Loktanella sp. S4079 TaxID=579483 RepID=UPI0005F9D966|nr:HAMP domain-containing sensor histidine kinase [Loktanella sp. S4079]KJZ18861.1 histidine kinase [Loktanella sp. S4079]